MAVYRASIRRIQSARDAWVAWRSCATDPLEVREINLRFRRDLWRWVALFAIGIVLGTALRRVLSPATGWVEAVTDAAAMSLWLLALIAVPWYHYRRISRHARALPLFAVVVVVAILAASALFLVAAGANPFGAAGSAQKWLHMVGMSVLTGVVTAGIAIGISRLRLREATQHAERMAAEAERERLARQAVQAELKLLQAQVEPHFLFNTLAGVRHLVSSGSADALPMLDHLIDYLRTSLPDLRSDASSLGREAELARAYLEIMRMRMGGELRFSIDIAPGLAAREVPPLMLMTLVENAVKHGVVPMGRGEVRIAARAEGERLSVTVADDGRGLAGAIGQGVGLANVRERLRALYGEAAALVLESGPQGGAVARLDLPA